MSEWQPIETAPRDGTKILAINNRGNQAVIIYEAKFCRGWVVCFSKFVAHPFWNGACGSVPTHWMRLPDPPPIDRKGAVA